MAIRLSDILEEETISVPTDLTRPVRLSDTLTNPIRLSDVLKPFSYDDILTEQIKEKTGIEPRPTPTAEELLKEAKPFIREDMLSPEDLKELDTLVVKKLGWIPRLATGVIKGFMTEPTQIVKGKTVPEWAWDNMRNVAELRKMGADVEPGLIPRAIAEYESARRGKLDVPGWVGEQIGWLTAAGPLFGLAGKIPGVKQLAPGIRKSVTEAGIVGAGLGLTEPAQTPLERVEHAGERAAGFAVFVGALHGLGKAGEQLFARFRRLTSAQQTELDTNLKIIFEKEPKKVTPERVETELAKAETKVTPAGVKGKGLLDLNTKDWKTSPEDLGYSLWTGEKSYQGNLPTLYAEKGGKVFEFDNK